MLATMHTRITILPSMCVFLLSGAAWAQPAQHDTGGPLFERVTESTRLAGVEATRVAFAELTGDTYPDAVIGITQVFINEGGKRFACANTTSPLAPQGRSKPMAVQFGDVNNDGFADLFLGCYTDLANEDFTDDGRRNEIWLGDGKGGFKQVQSAGVGTYPDTTIAACFVDVDRDGHLDLFVGNAYTAYGKSLEAFPDRLYHGNGDGTFVDVTDAAGLLGVATHGKRESRKPTYGVTHTDWNNDGWQDLLVATYGRQWNRLWRNNGDGTFTDVADATHFDGDHIRHGQHPRIVPRDTEPPFRANGNTFDCAVADFDGDGDMDCFLGEITHWWAGTSSDLSMLLVNQGPDKGYTFSREPSRIIRPRPVERWNQGDMHAGWLDVDNDGRLDLLIASSDYPDRQILKLYRQTETDQFVDWTDQLGFTWTSACQISLADYDRDGATDIMVATNNTRLTKEQRKAHSLNVGLFRNVAATRAGNGFVNIRLLGQSIGARVIVVTAAMRHMREVHGGLGHTGHHDDTDCRFGLGKATTIEAVEVHWPDATQTVQTFANVAPNRFYTLKKGGTLTPIP